MKKKVYLAALVILVSFSCFVLAYDSMAFQTNQTLSGLLIRIIHKFQNEVIFQGNRMVHRLQKGTSQNDIIVFLGDSLTSSGHWDEWFPDVETVNASRWGRDTSQVLANIDNIAALEASKIFIMVGINDLMYPYDKEIPPLSRIVYNHRQIIDALYRRQPRIQIFLLSILPVNENLLRFENATIKNEDVRFVNRALKSLAREHRLTYIDLHSLFLDKDQLDPNLTADGVHINAEAYERWVEAIRYHVSQ